MMIHTRSPFRGTPVRFSADAIIDFLQIPQLPTTYPNVLPRQSTKQLMEETVDDEGTNLVDEFNDLVDHEGHQLVVGLYVFPYDGTKSIKETDLSGFLKIMNIIIANNTDLQLHKTEVSMDQV